MAHGDETCYSCAAEETEKPGLRSFDVETWTAIGHSLKAEELLRFGMAVGRTLVLDRTMPNNYTIVEHIANRRLDETESDLLHLSGSPLAHLRTLELLCAHDPASHGPGATNAQRLAARRALLLDVYYHSELSRQVVPPSGSRYDLSEIEKLADAAMRRAPGYRSPGKHSTVDKLMACLGLVIPPADVGRMRKLLRNLHILRMLGGSKDDLRAGIDHHTRYAQVRVCQHSTASARPPRLSARPPRRTIIAVLVVVWSEMLCVGTGAVAAYCHL